ncbi:alpha/beta hydrolase [Pseudovibrio sp. Tun.PSC04-5.I4]|uniref:alpha/beta fold hydrolase n=1 Tax=Pseudovibrio sp. Tun.PSC04-5.I4 TaxID=1798213 RepID=UPI00088CE839|nr:alpha/beta hydrolase [Pseudovibrio sp. Tun.PSC04-5.I4]SDR39934.1 alpha/beta hydrolase fold [Pseudovibrio sp. Tun.PSC04-5.I4]
MSDRVEALMPPVKFCRCNGINMAVYEAGTGPAVVLLHGWPEIAYSWRYQIQPLVAAGYRVIAPDLRGYGKTGQPDEVDAYSMKHLMGDVIALLDASSIDQAFVCGHDWGGLLMWQLALFHPERLIGVMSLNTPFIPRSKIDPVEMYRHKFGKDMYIVAMQEEGRVDRLLDNEPERFLRSLMRRRSVPSGRKEAKAPTTDNMALFKEFEENRDAEPRGELLLSQSDLDVYVRTYQHSGFTGGLNWYRNFSRNWRETEGMEQIIKVPTLMICGADDGYLPPSLSEQMHQSVLNLERHVIKDCGHWSQQEKPEIVSNLLIEWLGRQQRT